VTSTRQPCRTLPSNSSALPPHGRRTLDDQRVGDRERMHSAVLGDQVEAVGGEGQPLVVAAQALPARRPQDLARWRDRAARARDLGHAVQLDLDAVRHDDGGRAQPCDRRGGDDSPRHSGDGPQLVEGGLVGDVEQNGLSLAVELVNRARRILCRKAGRRGQVLGGQLALGQPAQLPPQRRGRVRMIGRAGLREMQAQADLDPGGVDRGVPTGCPEVQTAGVQCGLDPVPQEQLHGERLRTGNRRHRDAGGDHLVRVPAGGRWERDDRRRGSGPRTLRKR
jgi:hypothetical protein